MLGVFPFGEDPDLLGTAGPAVPQHLPPWCDLWSLVRRHQAHHFNQSTVGVAFHRLQTLPRIWLLIFRWNISEIGDKLGNASLAEKIADKQHEVKPKCGLCLNARLRWLPHIICTFHTQDAFLFDKHIWQHKAKALPRENNERRRSRSRILQNVKDI